MAARTSKNEWEVAQRCALIAALAWSPASALFAAGCALLCRRWASWARVLGAGLVLAVGYAQLGDQWLAHHFLWHRGLIAAAFADPSYLTVYLMAPGAWRTAASHLWTAPLAGVLLLGVFRATDEWAEAAKKPQGTRGASRSRLMVLFGRFWFRSSPLGRWLTDRAQGKALGRYLGGDLEAARPRWVHSRQVVPPGSALHRSTAVIGASSSGKTVTCLRAAYLAALAGHRVVFLDCKGSEELVERFTAAMLTAGVEPDRLRLWPLDHYDVWRGSPDDLVDKIMGAIDWSSEGVWRDLGLQLLREACGALTPRGAKPKPKPTSAEQLLTQLRDVAATHVELRSTDRQMAAMRVEALFGSAPDRSGSLLTQVSDREMVAGARTLFDDGVAPEDCDALLVSLRGLGAEEKTRRVGRLILRDLEHYVGDAQRRGGRRTLLVVDELAVLGAGPMRGFVERARDPGATAVLLSAQGLDGLGVDAEPVYAECGVQLIHQHSRPRPLIDLAGTVVDPRASWREEDGRRTGHTSLTERERAKVDANQVRQLPPGQAFLVTDGLAGRVAVHDVYVPEEIEQQARQLIGERSLVIVSEVRVEDADDTDELPVARLRF